MQHSNSAPLPERPHAQSRESPFFESFEFGRFCPFGLRISERDAIRWRRKIRGCLSRGMSKVSVPPSPRNGNPPGLSIRLGTCAHQSKEERIGLYFGSPLHQKLAARGRVD